MVARSLVIVVEANLGELQFFAVGVLENEPHLICRNRYGQIEREGIESLLFEIQVKFGDLLEVIVLRGMDLNGCRVSFWAVVSRFESNCENLMLDFVEVDDYERLILLSEPLAIRVFTTVEKTAHLVSLSFTCVVSVLCHD